MANIISIDQDASSNYLPEPDENGKPRINPTYYKNIIIDHIETYIQENDIDRKKLTNNNMLAICQIIYESVFTNHHIKQRKNDNTPNSNIPYTTYNISTLLHTYKSICVLYGCMPSMYAFSMLTGISEDTINKYVTPASVEILKIRKEMLRNNLANDRMGQIVLANNDTSYGLLYTRQNAIESQAIKTGLSLSDLIPIEKKP